MDRPSVRESYRRHVRGLILESAYELAVAKGWDKVRMSEIAERAGASRALLYKVFGDKASLGDALLLREADRFLAGIHLELERHRSDAAAGISAAVQFTLTEAERSPLLKAVLISHRDATDQPLGVLPLLTTSFTLLERSTEVLVGWFMESFPELDRTDVDDAADALVRLTVSHLALPNADMNTTGRQITEVALRYLGLRS
ncbi:TetR family transcriptional regulator [Nocardioides pelophilus]|uniref:TetR family transcriptional regulator n=1 Tax=Nocardioides pelophilus TaxID=2172019 RepID=UPI0016005BF8|nr:TetR family transcriptional regulator [Nocardioides pelophilus]